MSIALNLMGGFELRCGKEHIPLPMNAQRLLAFLALHGRPLLRVYIAGQLWGDTSEQHSLASLRTVLWRLSRLKCSLIMATTSHLALADEVDVDARRVIDAAREMLNSPGTHRVLHADFSDELLPDWYDDWVETERERIRQLSIHGLETVAEDRIGKGEYGHAVDACLHAVRLDPLHESTYRLLIRIYLAEGNCNEALRAYRIYTKRLAHELGVDPSVEMLELVRGLTP